MVLCTFKGGRDLSFIYKVCAFGSQTFLVGAEPFLVRISTGYGLGANLKRFGSQSYYELGRVCLPGIQDKSV